MSAITLIVNDKLNELFQKHLPDTLYQSHYELADTLGATPTVWSSFLKDPENKRFIEREIASIAEASARKALNTLGSGDAITAQQVSGLKEILNKSQMIQQKGNSRDKIILTYLPKKEAR